MNITIKDIARTTHALRLLVNINNQYFVVYEGSISCFLFNCDERGNVLSNRILMHAQNRDELIGAMVVYVTRHDEVSLSKQESDIAIDAIDFLARS